MCVFIAVSVAGYRGDAAQPFRERHLCAEPPHASIGVPLPADGSTFSISDGHCACSVYPGYAVRVVFDAARERARYERKGWSPSKIDRAMEAKRAAHERPARDHDRVVAFINAVEELAISGARVTLLASDSDSSFHVSGAQRLALDEFKSSGGLFPQNTLVTLGG